MGARLTPNVIFASIISLSFCSFDAKRWLLCKKRYIEIESPELNAPITWVVFAYCSIHAESAIA